MMIKTIKSRYSCSSLLIAISITLIAFGSTPSHASDDIIYYWLDKAGVPKYSETPPRDGQKYQTILPKVTSSHNPEKAKEHIKNQQAQQQSRREKRLNQHEQHQQSIASAEIRVKNCGIVTKRLNSLKSQSRVSLQHSDGSIQTLSEEQRLEQIQIAQSQASQYCN